MTIAANTFTTFSSVGNREDLTDVIYRISPTETPVMSLAGRGKMDATFHEWQTDALAAPDSGNAQLQGDDITSYDAVTPTVRLGNRSQISRKTLVVADTEDVINKAGRKSETAYQKAKKSAELKLDMESIICSNQASVVGSTTVAPKMGSLLSMIKGNTSVGATGADPVTLVSTARTDGTQRAYTETLLKAVLSLCYTAGANPSRIILGATNKQLMSAFTGIASQQVQINAAAPSFTVAATDVYVSDFGRLKIQPSRLVRSRDVLVLDPEYIQVMYLRPFKWEDLAKTGDAKKSFVRVEYSLKVGNQGAHGLVADLS